MDEDAKRWLYWAIPIVVVIGAGLTYYYTRKSNEPKPEPAAQTQPAPSVAPPVQHPIEQADADKPLPELNSSDSAVQDSLVGALGRSLEQVLVPKDIVRHAVVTIDNLPRKKVAIQLRPLKPASGELAVAPGGEPTLSPDNAQRYAAFMTVVKNADVGQVVSVYRHFYPLFQQAYVDLGYPDGYFNDRLVEVIDHLLATPEVTGPIKLTQPSVFYQFADPSLEERSAGQKLMIRLGPQNATIVKDKLRALRKEVVKQQKPAAQQ
ncbi:MAG TPA: DUF3014 domain-containing protein [Steroidobacteraceae bacterium]|jgi:hypothetical protein